MATTTKPSQPHPEVPAGPDGFSPNSTNPVPQFISKKSALVLLFVIAMIIIISFSQYKDSVNYKTDTIPSPSPISTNDWVNYEDGDLGFSFEYPEDMGEISKSPEQVRLTNGTSYIFEARRLTKFESTEGLNPYKGDYDSFKVSIDGRPATYYKLLPKSYRNYQVPMDIYFIEDKEYNIVITLAANNAVAERIFSSFKFIPLAAVIEPEELGFNISLTPGVITNCEQSYCTFAKRQYSSTLGPSSSFIFVSKGPLFAYNRHGEELAKLNIAIGESRLLPSKSDSEFHTYTRTANTLIDGESAITFQNNKVWGSSTIEKIIYVEKNKKPFIIGGYIDRKTSDEGISEDEYNKIISTFKFTK